jgi:hypothetical protein
VTEGPDGIAGGVRAVLDEVAVGRVGSGVVDTAAVTGGVVTGAGGGVATGGTVTAVFGCEVTTGGTVTAEVGSELIVGFVVVDDGDVSNVAGVAGGVAPASANAA